MTEDDFEEFKKHMGTYMKQILEAKDILFPREEKPDEATTQIIETKDIKEVKINKN